MAPRRRTNRAGIKASKHPKRIATLAGCGLAIALLAGCDPALPRAVVEPTTSTTLTADASWYVPKVNDECPTAGATPTFSQAQWDNWLTALPQAAATSDPDSALISNTRINFPAGCYYVSTGVEFDRYHPLQNMIFSGIEDSEPGAEFVQLEDPRTNQYGDGPPMMQFDNVWGSEYGNPTQHITIDGFILTGSKPANTPYQPNSSSGISIGGGASDITVSNNIVRRVWGDAIYIGEVYGARIHHNNLYDVGRSTMSQTAGTDVEVDHNVMTHAAGQIFNLETNEGGPSVDRTYVHDNYGAYSQDQSTGTADDNGVLWNIAVHAGTTVSNVTFANNTSDSALVMWARSVGTSPTLPVGELHNILFDNNTTTSGAGGFRSYSGTDVTFRNNKMLGIVTNTQYDNGQGWTFNPPAISIGTVPSTACGAATGNTFVNAAGVTTPMPLNLYTSSGRVTIPEFPACT